MLTSPVSAVTIGGSNAASGWSASSAHRSAITLQQLTAFGMRNIALAGAKAGELMDLFFKLVIDGHVVYQSEVVRHTLNPVWMPFQSEDLALHSERGESIGQLFCGTCFDVIVVRVVDEQLHPWNHSGNAPSSLEADSKQPECDGALQICVKQIADADRPREIQILNATFNIRELDPLPVGLAEISNLPLNTCLFEFNGKIFVRRDVIELLVESGVISSKHSRRKGSAIQLKEYSLHQGVDNLEMIRSLKNHIEEVTGSNRTLQDEIRTQLGDAQQAVHKDHARSVLRERIHQVRAQIALKRDALDRMRHVMQDERKTFETDIHIPKALLSTMQMSMRYKDEKQGILERRCEVLRAAHKIRSRQAMLVKELGTVYPIEYAGAGEYSICGIKISSLDNKGTARMDEELLTTALGYIAHLVFMLSKYLHVNLRFKVVPYSSRSYMKDEINDPMGEYPLYRKGVAEKERYDIAIDLLKKDVQQLVYARGLDPTKDIPTLGRLKELTDVETSWLAKDKDLSASLGR